MVPSTGPLNSAISVLFFYKSGSQAFATAREVPLFHDTSFSVTGVSRYVSAVYTDAFKLVPGTVYGIKCGLPVASTIWCCRARSTCAG